MVSKIRVLLIGGGSGQQPRLRRLAKGVSTVVICRSSVLDWVHELHENDAVIVLNDESALENWLATARFVHRQWPLNAVAALAEIDQDKAAAIAADLGLAYHAPSTVQAVHDKISMRARLREAGVENLPYRRVDSLAELKEFFREVGAPLLLKPSRGRASAGIASVMSADELTGAFEVSRGASAPRLEPSPVIAERYVDGPEFSVESITHAGVHYVFAITEKFSDERSKVELGHVVPARITNEESRTLVAHVRRCLDALGVERGVTHSEVILGASGPVLVETHLRQAGDSIMQLTKSATGVDLTELSLRQILGEDLAVLPELAERVEGPHYRAAGAIRFLAPDVAGSVLRLDGMEQARAVSGVDEVEQLLQEGALLHGLRSSYSRVASARTTAVDADAALRQAERALDLLALHVSDS